MADYSKRKDYEEVKSFKPSIPDPWDNKGATIGALMVWIVIFAGFIAGAILLKNHGLSTICVFAAYEVFSYQIKDRPGMIYDDWKLHIRLTKNQK